jgi:hypothetical protein
MIGYQLSDEEGRVLGLVAVYLRNRRQACVIDHRLLNFEDS